MDEHQTEEPRDEWRLCVAPMLDWTDRHCRYFHRLITRRARLYTEMVTTGALRHGDVARHLDHDAAEHPLALQLGGSEPEELAHGARLAQRWGYDEVNLNCGCPSERVQRGAFGACLMAEPALVRDGVKAMRDAVGGDLAVSVKHRIGIDHEERYEFLRDFVATVAESGCTVFIVHARNAWLKGLSPKENREIPPLRHELVHRLKRELPGLTIVVNGGITDHDGLRAQLQQVDGVMVGRQAYHDPCSLAHWDRLLLEDGLAGDPPPWRDPGDDWRSAVEEAMVDYMARQPQTVPWSHVSRHILGLWHGRPGARRWRQVWSDHRHKLRPVREVAQLARQARLGGVAAAAG